MLLTHSIPLLHLHYFDTIEVWAQDIAGIMYYIDTKCNVYAAEDVVGNKSNPHIIARCSCSGGVYSIASFV